MAGYLFYPTADKEQDKIWTYTLETWGEAQAEKYLRDLHKHLEHLCATKSVWRKLPPAFDRLTAIGSNIFFSRYGQHLIFFREFPDGKIGILSLLHQKSDLPARLAADLQRVIETDEGP